jgi:aspartyl protease family protein
VPVHRLSLRAVRVGEVEVANVDAMVIPAQMPYILLGNSFLGRFQMRRDSDVLRLERRR